MRYAGQPQILMLDSILFFFFFFLFLSIFLKIPCFGVSYLCLNFFSLSLFSPNYSITKSPSPVFKGSAADDWLDDSMADRWLVVPSCI